MHMAFLSRGFKNLQWYGMTATERGLPCSVAFFHSQKRDALPDGVLFRISKREAPPAYAGGAVLISFPVPYRRE